MASLVFHLKTKVEQLIQKDIWTILITSRCFESQDFQECKRVLVERGEDHLVVTTVHD